jgi:hypothetical protein
MDGKLTEYVEPTIPRVSISNRRARPVWDLRKIEISL